MCHQSSIELQGYRSACLGSAGSCAAVQVPDDLGAVNTAQFSFDLAQCRLKITLAKQVPPENSEKRSSG